MRVNVDYFHDVWYEDALTLASSVNVVEAKPRTCRRQCNRPNQPAYIMFLILLPRLLSNTLTMNSNNDLIHLTFSYCPFQTYWCRCDNHV